MNIGNYSSSKNDEAPKPIEDEEIKIQSKKKFDTPDGQVVKGITEDLGRQVEADDLEAQSVLNYKQRLEEAEIDFAEAEEIVDSILTQGYYEERVNITKKKTALLRTRSHRLFTRALETLEAQGVRFAQTEQEIMARHAVAGSLVSFGGKKFPQDEDKSEACPDPFLKRMEWVEKQPEQLVRLLAIAVGKFDYKISQVMSEGVEDFI